MTDRSRPDITCALIGLCLLQVVGVGYYFAYFTENGYLPAPFVYDKSDTFMDFFHVMYWTNHPGRYTDWASVYPPLNFLIMRVIGWISIDPSVATTGFPYASLHDLSQTIVQYGGGFALRATSPFAIVALFAFYFAMALIFVSSGLWKGLNKLQRGLLLGAVLLSPPVLFALERGNIIILTLPLIGLVFAQKSWARIFALALLVNIKPYFVLLLLAWVLKGRWRELFYVIVASGTIFVVTGLALDLDFLFFFNNLFSFAGGNVFSGREVLAFPSTITAFAYSLRIIEDGGSVFSVLGLTGSDLATVLTMVNWVVLVLSVITLGLYRDRLSLEAIMAMMAVLISNLGVWVGGYALLVYPALVPTLFIMRWRWLHLGILTAIFLPVDSWVLFTQNVAQQNVFLSGAPHFVDWQLTAASFVRPSLNFLLLISMSLEIIVVNFRLAPHTPAAAQVN